MGDNKTPPNSLFWKIPVSPVQKAWAETKFKNAPDFLAWASGAYDSKEGL